MNQFRKDEREIEALARSWLDYYRLQEHALGAGLTSQRDENFWAVETLMRASRDDPEYCWHAILTLLTHARTDLQVANIAAGPLEDLLVNHGEAYIERIEEIASANERFREMLGGVWKNAISGEVWARVERLRAVK